MGPPITSEGRTIVGGRPHEYRPWPAVLGPTVEEFGQLTSVSLPTGLGVDNHVRDFHISGGEICLHFTVSAGNLIHFQDPSPLARSRPSGLNVGGREGRPPERPLPILGTVQPAQDYRDVTGLCQPKCHTHADTYCLQVGSHQDFPRCSVRT